MKLLKGCWYCLMAASFLAGRVTGRREFFLLLFIMGFILIFSLCLNIWTARSFCYLQDVEKNVCVKGGQTNMHVTITNDKPFPFSLIRLNMITIARSQKVHERFSLQSGSSITFTVPLACPYRGIHNVGITTLEINDSFGLVKTTFNMLEMPYYSHIEVKVYPQLTELGILPAVRSDSKQIGNAGKWNIEQGESYAGLRPYRPGDPFKRVHRAVSSRMRELYVRTYDMPLETSIIIALDTATACDNEEEGLYLADLACQCAAAIANHSLKTGHRVLYHDAGLSTALDLESVYDFPRLYDRLAELNFEPDNGATGAIGVTGATRATRATGITEAIGAIDGFPKLAARNFLGAQAAYIISARGSEGIMEAMSSIDKARTNIKLIAIGPKSSTTLTTESTASPISGIQIIPIKINDDLPTALTNSG